MSLRATHAGRVCADLATDESTGRDMLFSNPGAELPDVYLSESVVFVEESTANPPSNQQTYTVVLTHPPGMREDETVSSPRSFVVAS